MITIGKKVPDFTLEDKDGTKHTLSKIKSKYTVIYFYPKDNTPGCTIEAKKFNDKLDEFEKLNATIIGISGGDQKSKNKFCCKHDLKILLLSDDENFSVCKKFECFGKKKFMGREFDGIFRNSYLIDSEMRVIKIYEKAKPAIHAEEILKDIENVENLEE